MLRDASSRSSRRWALAAACALVVAYAYLVQPSGDNQKAHYLLTRALADARPTVDEVRTNPSLKTGDVVRFEGHYYAAKAPGLALASTPPYAAARAAGLSENADPARVMWALHLLVVVLPAGLLLVLVHRMAERLEPGTGPFAAAALGLATLVFPFANLFFSHVLAGLLAFAAFALLWRESERGGRLAAVGAAGLLAGLAVTTDYPLALVAVVLGVYAAAVPGPRLRRTAAYAAGTLVGIAPLLLFNTWAFGSPTHLPYEGWHEVGAEPLPGVFGITLPSLANVLKLLFVPAGLAALAPAAIGMLLLYRRGLRRECAVIAAVVCGFVAYNAGFVDTYGGASPGPRYLIPALPFLAVPLALAYRRLPGVALGLALGAAAVFTVYTATTPLAAWDGNALDRFRSGTFVPTAADLADASGWLGMVPFFAAVLVAAAYVGRSLDVRSLGGLELLRGAVALAAWALVVRRAPALLFDPEGSRSLEVLLLAAAGTAAVASLYARPVTRAALGVAVALRHRRAAG